MVQYVMGEIYDFHLFTDFLRILQGGLVGGGTHCLLENRVGNVGPFSKQQSINHWQFGNTHIIYRV
jgi:hypothetical protein